MCLLGLKVDFSTKISMVVFDYIRFDIVFGRWFELVNVGLVVVRPELCKIESLNLLRCVFHACI